MSLNVPKKKLFFSILIILGIIIVIGLFYWGGSSLISYWKDKELRDSQRKIELYESKIKTLNATGNILNKKIIVLSRQVDSLKKVKQQTIYVAYEKEANAARRNIAIEHAKWMDSVITELKHNSHTK